MANPEENGKITFRTAERYVGFAIIIVTLVIYFTDINYKLDKINVKLDAHVVADQEKTKRNIFTHSVIAPAQAMDCRACMGKK